ncbi:pentatricopeptide repeat-containing protein At4g21705, mitochondrial [Andrographis paniculata]|uniref:pentatricopeptide repeat-containing protein At4g21705, mitochondrial n=1 Tax=Andrographis paniculata TaxID=175694 RepID=UPI0021E7C44F|nr:pentatricopeptide repeat-containing protein At4g21705, mitochondrial [Andrographis paniculata]
MLSSAREIRGLIRRHVVGDHCYYTNSKQKSKASLYGRISPMGSPTVNVTPELEKWVEMGNKVRFAELQRIIVDLRKRKRYNQALQVSEWMKNRGFAFTPVQHAVQLDLIGKVHGFESAEDYFSSLSEEDKTDKAYGALLHCYVRQRQTEKALVHFNTIKEKGLALSSVAYNDLMCLYSDIGKNAEIPEIFNQMRNNGCQPDNLSYRICITSFGARSDIKGLESILNEMECDANIVMDWNTYAVVANFLVKAELKDKANSILEKAEGMLDSKDGLGYNHLISLHARMGNRDKVLSLWCLEKDNCKRCLNKDYLNMLDSLVKLDELEEADKVLKEWELSRNCYDFRVPSVVIVGYIEKGLCGKSEELLRDLVGMGKETTPNIWGRLVIGYLEKGKMDNGLECLKMAISLCEAYKGAKIGDKVVTKLLKLVGEKGRLDDAEKVVTWLRSAIPLRRHMYKTFLNSYITSGGEERERILDILKADKYEKDEEFLKILEAA